MHPKLPALIGVGVLVAALAGCGATTSNPVSSTSKTPQHGGTAVYALQPQSSPNWFFPLVSFSADTVLNYQTDYMMYKPLVYFNKHDQIDYKRSLASSVTWNSSGSVYTITLNKKWHWSNGAPVTAQDVVFTYNILRAASLPNTNYAWTSASQGFGGMPTIWQSVMAVGTHKVVVTLTKPRNSAWFIRNGLTEIIPVPKSVWDVHPNNMTKELAFINSVANSPTNSAYKVVDGPYKLQSMTPNSQWVFVPNPLYDGHKSYLNKVIFQYETSPANEFTALKTGTLNVGYLGMSLLGSKNQLTNDTLTVPYTLGFNYFNINMNSNAPGGIGKAFQTLPVRQALQLGVDQSGMIQHIFHGYGVIDDTTLAPMPKTPFFDPALATQPYAYNPARGKAILKKAGWHLVNGVMTKGNIKLEFTLDYAAGSRTGTSAVELMKADWAQEGIIVHLVSQPFDTVVSYSQANATKWAAINWGQGNLGGWSYGNPYPSGGGLFGQGGAENSGGYNSATMNTLIQDTYKPGTSQQQLTRLYAYESYAAHHLPSAIFLPWEPQLLVHENNIHGTVSSYNPVGDVIAPNYWWVSK